MYPKKPSRGCATMVKGVRVGSEPIRRRLSRMSPPSAQVGSGEPLVGTRVSLKPSGKAMKCPCSMVVVSTPMAVAT